MNGNTSEMELLQPLPHSSVHRATECVAAHNLYKTEKGRLTNVVYIQSNTLLELELICWFTSQLTLTLHHASILKQSHHNNVVPSGPRINVKP
ncbi:hypothetical protein DERF_014019 [Dermatophagoides farinae]|uniref:Uncharacterized protein n=1 Tax=Dermatophagoides farinae TaxID=6954 RepID=A0A922HNH8_DERFA|nr:hypothetical protein DERF_014019 [Dermatophagoides farinae]